MMELSGIYYQKETLQQNLFHSNLLFNLLPELMASYDNTEFIKQPAIRYTHKPQQEL